MKPVEIKIIELGKKRRFEELDSVVKNLSSNQICSLLSKTFCHADIGVLVTYICQSLDNTDVSKEKRFKICEELLKELQRRSITTAQTKAVVSLLAAELDYLSSGELLKLVSKCIEYIQNGESNHTTWKDIFPILMKLIVEKGSVQHEGSEISGKEYKTQVINTLCMTKWKPEIVPALAVMFLEVQLNADEHLQIVLKLCKSLSELSPDDIPPLVLQLLKLCKHRHGIPLFLELQQYFSSRLYSNDENVTSECDIGLDSDNRRKIQQAESTVYLYIYQSAQADQSILKDLIKSFKSIVNAPEIILDPFFLSILLAISTVNFLEDQALELLKQVIIRVLNENEKRKYSAWVRSLTPGTCDIKLVLKTVIDNCGRERDHVFDGLIRLCLILLDIPASKVDIRELENLHNLARNILVKVVKKQKLLTSVVLQNLTHRIVYSQQVNQYTDCLYQLCVWVPFSIIDNMKNIFELLDHLGSMSEDAACGVISALIPLVKDSNSLRTTLTITLHKSLYSRNIQTRQMAVHGIIDFLRHLDMESFTLSQSSQSTGSFSSSQVDIVSHSQTSRNSSEATSLELLNMLRRCFMQQSSVRTRLYQGFYNIISKNASLLPKILNFLFAHLQQFTDTDDNTMMPIDFSRVVEMKEATAVLKEPIANLLFIVQQLTLKAMDNKETIEAAENLENILNSLCNRIPMCAIEDFGLDDTLLLQDSSPEHQKMMEIFTQLFGIHEALMSYTMNTWTRANENRGQMMINLLKSYNKLLDFAKTNSSSKKSKENLSVAKFRPLKIPATILDFQTVIRMLQLIYTTVSWSTVNAAEALKTKREFHRFVLQITLQLVHQFPKKKNSIKVQWDLLNPCIQVANILFENVVCRLGECIEFDIVSTTAALECFEEILSLFVTQCRNQMPQLLQQIVSEQDLDEEIQAVSILKELQKQLSEIIAKDDVTEDQLVKIPMILSDCITLLTVDWGLQNDNALTVYSWLKNFAQTSECANEKISKSIVTCLLKIFSSYKASGALLSDLTLQLLDNFGRINTEDKNREKYTHYKIVSDPCKVGILSTLVQELKRGLENVNWVVERISGQFSARAYNESQNRSKRQEQLKNIERDLCLHLSHYLTVVINLSKMAVPVGTCADAILRLLSSTYGTLIVLTKYFIHRSSKVDPAFQSCGFTQVITLSGKHLAKQYDLFITYIEEIEREQTVQKTEAKKGKKADNTALKSQVMKSAKSRPALVFKREQFERLIILLSNQTKIDLMKHIKQNASRDFHISSRKIQEALDNQKSSDEDEEENQDINNREDKVGKNKSQEKELSKPVSGKTSQPPKKKPRKE